MGLLIVVLFSVSLLIVYSKTIIKTIKTRGQWSKLNSLPSLGKAYPLIGHAHLFPSDTTKFWEFIRTFADRACEDPNFQFGTLWLGPVPMLVLVHPNAAEVILRTSKHSSKSFVYRFLLPWLGEGLLISKGKKWYNRRRLITPAFHFSILSDFVDVMNEQSSVMIKRIEETVNSGNNVDMAKRITLCALDIICETAMGQTVSAQSNDDSEYVESLYRLSHIAQQRQKNPLLWWDYTFDKLQMGKEHQRCLDIAHSFTRNVIASKLSQENVAQISKDDTDEQKKHKTRLAFLDVLINARDEDGKPLSPTDIQEEVDTFMFEGHDTTAAGMTWALYLIGSHPDVQEKVHEELDSVFGKGSDRPATMDDLGKLNYLDRVIKETLRLFPSVPLMGRVTTEDCIINNQLVPKDTEVAVLTYQIHHNKHVWDDPERFDPDRFLPKNMVSRHPFAYIPFSAGPRNCIGQRFAILEEKVMLSAIFRRYNVTCPQERSDIEVNGDIILRPNGEIKTILQKRS